jgi:putative oxidoreductase
MGGALVGVIEVSLLFSRPTDPCIPLILPTFDFTLAMIGPGAWSVDARLFG